MAPPPQALQRVATRRDASQNHRGRPSSAIGTGACAPRGIRLTDSVPGAASNAADMSQCGRLEIR